MTDPLVISAPVSIASNTTSPKVAVVMPVFNSDRFIVESIASITNQTLSDLSLFVVDDVSTDQSFDLINGLAQKDDRIHAIRLESKSGVVVARNHALKMARCRYIAFCDSDDIWMPDKLEKQLKAIKESGHGICCTAYTRTDEAGQVLGGVVTPPPVTDYARLLRSNCIGMSTALIDTHICGEIRLPNIARRQDYALWLQLARQGHTALGLQEPLVQYRVHSGSLSSNKFKAAYYHWKVLRNLEKIPLPQALWYFSQYFFDASKKRF